MKLINKLIQTLSATTVLAASTSYVSAQVPDPDGKPADMSKPVQVYILLGTRRVC